MILRIFRAVIYEDRVDDFKRMVREQSIPWLMESDGMLGYFPGEPFGDNNPVVTGDEAPLVEAMYADHYQRFDQ